MRHIGRVLGGPPPRQDRAPVRRHSRLTGTCEGQLWHRTDRRELRRIVLAARRYELAGRQRGRRTGPLGHVALEVLELLANLTDHRSGRLEPSLAYLMRQLRRSRDAIVRGLAALRAHGFADWMRRFERVEAEGPGPRVRQVSNAYRLVLPPRAARLLGARGQDVPLPDDVAQAQEDRREAVAALKASLGLDELPLVEVADDPLRRALAAMGRELEKRESGRRSEPQTEILI